MKRDDFKKDSWTKLLEIFFFHFIIVFLFFCLFFDA